MVNIKNQIKLYHDAPAFWLDNEGANKAMLY